MQENKIDVMMGLLDISNQGLNMKEHLRILIEKSQRGPFGFFLINHCSQLKDIGAYNMNLTISARHFEMTPAMESYAKTKFEKVWSHFEILSGHIRLSSGGAGSKVAQVDIHIKGKDVHIEESDLDLYAAIDKLVEASHRVLKKEKEKREKFTSE